MNSDQVRHKYLQFFEKRGHKIIPSSPLVPENDPTTLFTSSGMQQLVPFLKGESHPMGKRLVDSQPSVRVQDIEEVGDNRHTTFFEMLGNWSLGDYFKKEQLSWFYEFLTKIIGLKSNKLYATVFAGDKTVPQDEESIKILQQLFNTKRSAQKGEEGFDSQVKIYTYSAKENWWSRAGAPDNMPPGEIGGPDSEIFYDFETPHDPQFGKVCHLNCNCGRFMEIGNSVFMEYEKQEDGTVKPLPKQNVDFGGGLERIVAASLNTPDVFQTDLFQPLITVLETASSATYSKHALELRLISDHIKGATMMAAEGIIPGNKEQGYIMRRLIRRAAVKMKYLNLDYTNPVLAEKLVAAVTNIYSKSYPQVKQKASTISQALNQELSRFSATLKQGIKKLASLSSVDGKVAFDLYQSYGLPLEITEELLAQMGKSIDRHKFAQEFKNHQQKSRAGAKSKFAGGLADKSAATIKLHTATHLLHQSLRQILGDHVRQQGSNITAKRLRFDFSWPKALTPQQIKSVETLINQKIKADLPVTKTLELKNKALNSGAIAFFKEKYPEKVSVYTIGEDLKNNWFSKEFCAGPHVSSTGEIGTVTINKQSSIGGGIRRIYATLS